MSGEGRVRNVSCEVGMESKKWVGVGEKAKPCAAEGDRNSVWRGCGNVEIRVGRDSFSTIAQQNIKEIFVRKTDMMKASTVIHAVIRGFPGDWMYGGNCRSAIG